MSVERTRTEEGKGELIAIRILTWFLDFMEGYID